MSHSNILTDKMGVLMIVKGYLSSVLHILGTQ